MNVRDLSHKVLRKLAADSQEQFEDWWKRTEGKMFGTGEPLGPKKIFEYAFARGISAVLQRIDEIRNEKK